MTEATLREAARSDAAQAGRPQGEVTVAPLEKTLLEAMAPVATGSRLASEVTEPASSLESGPSTSGSTLGALVKRLLDLTVALLLLVLCLPGFALLACLVWIDSGRPIIFRARRLGKGGRVFTMYKFRTMVPEAPRLLAEYAHLNLGVGMVKIPNDPRVTRAGRWLRAFSIDELPQLWNVVRGDMSLVGPRPHDVGELSLTDAAHRLRLSVRPGLTGLWQVAARDDPQLSTRVHHDLSYVQNWSLWIDAKIVLKTVPVVLKGCGDRITQREPAGARESSAS